MKKKRNSYTNGFKHKTLNMRGGTIELLQVLCFKLETPHFK